MDQVSKHFKLSDVISVDSNFGRSVNLERDFYSDRSIDGYVLTSTARIALERIAASRVPGSNRAWTLTGPYGSGKSTFALFAAKLFDYQRKNDTYVAREILKLHDDALWTALFRQPGNSIELFSILVNGSREPIFGAILRAIRTALDRAGVTEFETVRRRVRRLAGHGGDGHDLVQLLDDVARAIGTFSNNTGILIVIDELGKLLEHAAFEPETSDVFLLQILAEAANDPKRNLFVVTSLHQAFDQYAGRLNRADREEWMKVQGRFEDIAFQEPNEQVLHVLQKAFKRSEGQTASLVLESVGNKLAAKAVSLGLCRALEDSHAKSLLSATMPLHPVVTLTLGPIFRRFGQNERSLFAFLTSEEPFGLKEFLAKKSWSANDTPVLTLDIVYDYLLSALGSSLYIGPESRRWTEIEAAIDRLGREAGAVELKLLKTVGLLRIIGDLANLKPSRKVLRFALDTPGIKGKEVDRAIESLLARSILIERRFNDTFSIWEGSDINIEERIAEAERQVDRSTPIASILRRDFGMRPVVAKRHSHESGSLRYFEIDYADSTDLDEVANKAFGSADARIVYVLPRDRHDLKLLEETLSNARWQNQPRIVFAVLDRIEQVSYWIYRAACCRWVRANTPEIEGDRSARLELIAQQSVAEQEISAWLGEIQHVAGSTGNRWYWKGSQLDTQNPRKLQNALSEVFDEVFFASPSIINELVNRNVLSAAAITARKHLLEAMINNGDQERLGIEGYPPQLSMYLSVLCDTDIHRNERGITGFFEPRKPADQRIIALWRYIDQLLDETEKARKPVDVFFEMLAAPPYGLKRGLQPIILAAVLLRYESELALYEQGNFVAKLSLPVFERLIRNPHNFDLQLCRIEGSRVDALEQMIRTFAKDEVDFHKDRKTLNVLTLVRPLMRFANGLDSFTKHTYQISETAQGIRQALLSAREPDRLLFKLLPEACGFAEFDTKKGKPTDVRRFCSALFDGIAEIKRAHAELLFRVEGMIVESFQAASRRDAMRSELSRRSAMLEPHVADKKLKSFIIRAQNADCDFDQWIESLAALVTGKPTTTWNDDDLNRLQINLTDFARSFINLERVVFAFREREDTASNESLVRLSVTRLGEREHERIIQMDEGDQAEVNRLEQILEESFKNAGVNGNIDLRLSVLTRMSLKLLDTGNNQSRSAATKD